MMAGFARASRAIAAPAVDAAQIQCGGRHSSVAAPGPGGWARWLGSLILFVGLADGDPAQAHVKWFAHYDMTHPPLPIGEVVTPQFVYFFLANVFLVYAFFWFDRYVYRKRILDDVLRRFTVSEPTAFLIMRGAALVFFASVSAYGFFGQGFFLTPELKTDARWVPWVQLGIALWTLDRRTVPLIGVGAAALFVAAATQHGVFHMLDYLILIGVSYYFLAAAMSGPGWVMSRYIVLYATTGLTLLWASIEKWGYPSWTYPLLARNPDLLMGMDASTYMVLAGYVEFTLTYMLLSSASLLSRALALGLGSVFALAIFKFGMIDAVGHLMIIAILVVLVLHGPTKGRSLVVLDQKSLWTEAYFMTSNYIFFFVMVFIAYYGLHHLAYGA
jgi:hypothetical protein